MAFDRNAINTGRPMQDFGLCDLKGVYQHSTRLRSKGFLVVAFLRPSDPSSISVAKTLQEWTTVSDKVTVVAVAVGERSEAETLFEQTGVTFPVLWDFEAYTASTWAVSAAPAIFIVSGQGLVLGRVLGHDKAELDAARSLLVDEVAKAEAAAKAAAEAKAAADAAAKK
jgi:peroxiredoxin